MHVGRINFGRKDGRGREGKRRGGRREKEHVPQGPPECSSSSFCSSTLEERVHQEEGDAEHEHRGWKCGCT